MMTLAPVHCVSAIDMTCAKTTVNSCMHMHMWYAAHTTQEAAHMGCLLSVLGVRADGPQHALQVFK